MTSVADTAARAKKSHSKEWLFCALCLLLLTACAERNIQQQLQGTAMGTTWHVSYVPQGESAKPDAVYAAIDAALVSVDESMSTYREDSEIARVNAASHGEAIEVSANFARVLAAALRVGALSGGAYDVTVGPLVRLWGFGPGDPIAEPPAQAAIDAARAQVGQGALQLNGTSLTRSKPVALDFSSLAKGFAVDLVADALESLSIERYLVEVGGEMKLAGLSGRGDLWRIAIEQPDNAGRSVAEAISLTDRAVATSGDYRNYFEVDGERYSHSIDARSGYPVQHDLVSVTVVHDSAMLADAWATALIVLGAERAAALAEEQALAVYFIRRKGEQFMHSHSSAFTSYLDARGEDAGEQQ